MVSKYSLGHPKFIKFGIFADRSSYSDTIKKKLAHKRQFTQIYTESNMKNAKRIICLLLVIVTLFSITAMPISAKPVKNSVSGSAGRTITVDFQFDNIIAIDGIFSFSNPELFSSVDVVSDELVGLFNPTNGRADFFGSRAIDCVLSLKLTVAENAQIGEQCEITFRYETTETGYLPSTPVYQEDHVTFEVVKGVDYSALQEAIAKADSLDQNEYTASSWAEMRVVYTTARRALSSDDQSTVDSATNELNLAIDRLVKISVDYSALKKQIRIAEDLDEADYTPASWENMQSQLSVAKVALGSKEQSVVDRATANLKAAINALVRAEGRPTIDFTELKRQIAKAEALNEVLYTPQSWANLTEALDAAREALDSSAQSVVDSAAEDLKDAINALVKVNLYEVDYTELNKQIAIAEGLNLTDYTAESRSVMLKALDEAIKARESDSQLEVNEAAVALKEAIAALVRMDFSALLSAIESLRGLAANDTLSELWIQMIDLITKAETLKQNGDQAAVDQCAKDITDLMAKIVAESQKSGQTQIIEVEKKVPTEPTEDYCNISHHPIWPILFWISLAINLVGILLIVGFLLLRRKRVSDDTPLVDYDIDDDAE